MPTQVDFRVNVSQLRQLTEQLRKARPEILREVEAGLVAAGEIVAADARRRSSFSRRIPASIVVRRRRTVVRVRAGDKNAPHAAPFNNHGAAGNFRHPVFGNPNPRTGRTVWVNQPAHPFMQPALEAQADNVAHKIVDVVNDALGKLGL